MKFRVEIAARARKDLRSLDREDARRVLRKLMLLETDLGGDVARLTEFRPEYRLRVGDLRVLFDVEGDVVIVRRVLHRSKAYER